MWYTITNQILLNLSEKHFITPAKFNFSNCRKIVQEDAFRWKDLNNNVIFLFVRNIIKYIGLCFLYIVSEPSECT